MRPIILDHIRRWWWVWIPSGIVCGMIVSIGRPLALDLSNAFVPLVIYLGWGQLSMDLVRGDVCQVLRIMPVSSRQVGRAWWWASVGGPALFIGGVTLVSFLLAQRWSQKIPSGAACLVFWVTNALLFGPQFFLFTLTPGAAMPRASGEKNGGCLSGLLLCVSTLVLVCFYKLFPPFSIQWGLIMAVCLILTVQGWRRSEHFASERLRRVVKAHSIPNIKIKLLPWGRRAAALKDEGYGGMRLLFAMLFGYIVGLGAGMVVMMGVALFVFTLLAGWFAKEQPLIGHSFVVIITQVIFWIACWQTIGSILHVRFLRSLPISLSKLTGVLILAQVLAMLAVLLVANVFFMWLFPPLRTTPWEMLFGGAMIQISLATLVVPIVIRRGMDLISFCIVMLLLIGSLSVTPFGENHLSLGTNILGSLGVLLGCYLVTLSLLAFSSKSYRPRHNPFGNVLMGRFRIN